MHQISGRRGVGISLALVTALLWAVLPIALKVALQELDPYTASWVRLTVSGVLVASFLAWRGRLKLVLKPDTGLAFLCGLAALGLLGNYLFYNFSLQRLNPGNGAVIDSGSALSGADWQCLSLSRALFQATDVGCATGSGWVADVL